MTKSNEEKARTTIADLVATDSGDKTGFFQSAQQVPEKSGTASQGTLNRVQLLDVLRAADMLVPDSPLGPTFYDEYRRIKRPLLSNAFGKTASLVERGNLVLVTSSIPGEGKTHTAVNLSLSVAQERDHTVLLVDCDVTRKGVSHMLGLADCAGLVELLENEDLNVGNVLQATDIPNMSVLSAGRHHEYVTELLASQRMSSLVDEMAARYDDRLIIFDGPPLLPTPQTQVLAGLVGQVAFVVESGKTPQSLVEEALELIPEEKATGIVMNKSEGISERSGYYYGYYGSDQEKSKS